MSQSEGKWDDKFNCVADLQIFWECAVKLHFCILPRLHILLRLHNIESKLDDLKHMETSILGPEQTVTR